ncbi:MAG: aminoglycoside phosphotransferase family protein, partial [Clostridiales bacterium]|nr:aminoglycoside phosphotransferase family protein [Clostridiales bacterium]
KDPEAVMRNQAEVIEFLKQKASAKKEVASLVPTKYNALWHVEPDGEYWRLYDFIQESVCLESAASLFVFRECARAFGKFQASLSDFPAEKLVETIPRFHDTPFRYTNLHEAIDKDPVGRVKECQREINFLLQREKECSLLMDLKAAGVLPLRVTHNDTKLSNILFNKYTRKAMCIIDLDTVMPGLSVTDYGDAIRYGASTAAEDEVDLSKVKLSLPHFVAYTEGFLSVIGDSLTSFELDHLRDGTRIITLELATRFLADYLLGDVYFKITRPRQNLDRTRTQVKMAEEFEEHWNSLEI